MTWFRRPPGRLSGLLLAAGASAALIACDSSEGIGTGDLTLRVSGEGAAKVGYPYEKNGALLAFGDDWSISFDKFLVSLGQVELRASDGAEAVASTDTFIADLHRGDPVFGRYEGLDARRWDRLSFRILPPDGATINLNDVAAEDIERMRAGGFNYWIEGSATLDEMTYTFAWGLANPTRNSSCSNGLDGTDGLVVRTNSTTEAEITIHVDHLFWDTLGSEIAAMRFTPIAAASTDDTHVDFEELAGQLLSDLRDIGGEPLQDGEGQRIVYNPGAVPIGEPNLMEFVLASAASAGHVNGLGLCTVSAL